MATYSVTCSNVGSFTYGNRFTLYVKLSNRDGNPATNKSVVDYEAYFENTSGGGTFSSKTRLYFAINGQVIKDSTGEVTGPRNGRVTIAQGSITVDHNSDGNKSVGFQALVQSTNLGIYGNIENSFALTKIPRYTSITRFAVNKRDETSVTFDYATSDTTDYAWYSKDNGSTWSNLPTNNIVTGLSANTTYNFKLRVRRKDSQLTTDSGTYAQTTYNYPYCTEAPDFVIGNNVTVKFYNPLNRSIQIRMWSHRSAQFVSDLITTSGTSYTGFSNIASRLYESIPNNTNSGYNIDVHYGSNKAVKQGGNYRTVGNEAPSFYNFTYRDTDAGTTALTGNNQTIVKGYSNVEAIVSTANKATPKNSASMSKYRLSIGEATAEVAYSSSAQVATTIANVLSNSFTMYAIDSRGYSTAKTITASTYINYSPIKITSLNAIRTNSVTSETTLNFSGTIWNGSFGSVTNAINSCSYRYRRAGTSTWTNGTTNVTPTKNGSNFSFSGKIVGDLGATGFNIDNGYEIQVLIADKLSNNHGNPNTFTLGPGTPAMAIYKNNVAIGQRYDTGDGSKLQVNGQTKLKGNVLLKYSPVNFGGCRDITIEGAYVRLFTVDLTAMYKTASIWFALTDTQTADENLLCNLYVHNGNNSTVVYSFKYLSTLAGFDTSRLVAVVTGSTRTEVYLKMWDTDSPAITILSLTKMFEDNDTFGKITIDCNTTVTSLPSGNKYNPTGLTIATSVLSQRGHINWANQTDGNGHLIAKSALAFWNGAYDSNNASNLVYCHEGPIQAKPTTLYSNDTGTTGTVTLSQSAANFNYLEIFYKDNQSVKYNSSKVNSPNGKSIGLNIFGHWLGDTNDSACTDIRVREIIISGNSIITATNNGANRTGYVSINESDIQAHDNNNYIYIIKVVGYK